MLLQTRAKVRQLLGGEFLGGQFRRSAFERTTKLEQFTHIISIERLDVHSALRRLFENPLRRQLNHRFPHRGVAHADFLGDLGRGEHLPLSPSACYQLSANMLIGCLLSCVCHGFLPVRTWNQRKLS